MLATLGSSMSTGRGMEDPPFPWAHCAPLLLGTVGNKSCDYFLYVGILKLGFQPTRPSGCPFPKPAAEMQKELPANPTLGLVPPSSGGHNLHTLNLT